MRDVLIWLPRGGVAACAWCGTLTLLRPEHPAGAPILCLDCYAEQEAARGMLEERT